MPQLAKGGKWVFGWVVVGQQGEVRIPPEAYSEYGFQPGEPVIFIRGSQRSGGFGLGRGEGLALSPIRSRIFESGNMGAQMQVILPKTLAIEPGVRLLVVRGSGLALGFLQQGPIYEEALRHPEIEMFSA
jgi:hypothetical protein